MNDSDQPDFLEYYRRELAYLRRMSGEFARQYPQVAGRLELSEAECTDPHVERLIESFAVLTARIQAELDEERPSIASALLGVLYPQFQSPIPPMSIARFDIEPGVTMDRWVIPRHTPVAAEGADGSACQFRTCYEVEAYPLEVTDAALVPPERYGSLGSDASAVRAVVRLRIRANAPMSLDELDIPSLRFFLHGEWRAVGALYELLTCNLVGGMLSTPDGGVVSLPGREAAVVPSGFAADQDALPYPPHAHRGLRLLQEYLVLPAKFLFFDVRLPRALTGQQFDLLFLLDEAPRERLAIDAGTFALGCTPIVNLFAQVAEPIRLDHRQTEYRLVPDIRHEQSTEVHSIERVTVSADADQDPAVFEPFFSFDHDLEDRDHRSFWVARRQRSDRGQRSGTDVYLSFLDLDFEPRKPHVETAHVHTLCTNRDLAEGLAPGAPLTMSEGGPVQATCLRTPTRRLDPPLGPRTIWRLVSLLSLNHLSLTDGEESLPALRELLKLLDFSDSRVTSIEAGGITAVSSRPVMRQVSSRSGRGFCRGVEVSIEFDESAYLGRAAVLAAVLNRFLGQYASVNSFSALSMRYRNREKLKRWPAIAGETHLL